MRLFFQLVLFVLIAAVFILNLKLYYQPSFNSSETVGYKKSVLAQLNHLENKIHKGANKEMQNIYPEGFVFMTSLYGLTWCNFIEKLPKDHKLYLRGLTEIRWAIEEIDSNESKAVFDKELQLPYGAFYTGWKNYLLGKYLSIHEINNTDSTYVQQFRNTCDAITYALKESDSPFLESYAGFAWPADMTVCMASLALYDRIFTDRYQLDLQDWIEAVDKRTDQYGLIPHSVGVESGMTREASRGSSQSLILNFLFDIDSAYALEKFQIYDSLFLDNRLGLPGIREYPKGSSGSGDIDSGPVLLGIGGAASIVGQRTMSRYRKDAVAIAIRNSIEAFGFSMTVGSRKNFLFGVLPMADAFIAWSNSIENSRQNKLQSNANWRTKFQIYSLILVIACSVGIYCLRKRKVRL